MVKTSFRRVGRLRFFLGVLFAVLLVFFIRRIGNDDEDELLNQKPEKLYFTDFNAQPIRQQQIPSSPKKIKPHFYRMSAGGCHDYKSYAEEIHEPLSSGPLKLAYQRPVDQCRTFNSPAVEQLIKDLKERILDQDLARLVENALPNTLDTTVLWHKAKGGDKFAQTFVVTGDIHAEWLRDAARQLSVYQPLAQYDESLQELMRGAINTQASYILVSPYCNAFHPPPGSGIKKGETAMDEVTPQPHWKYVFECKWEIDSLASFLTLTNEYYEATHDHTIFNELWVHAMLNILTILKRESSPTFDEDGKVLPFYYTFQRNTNVGTETLPLAGTGNPVNFGIGLVRSAFRPSDDACIFQFFIPGNAHMSVELLKISEILKSIKNKLTSYDDIPKIIERTAKIGQTIRDSIYQHAVKDHPEFGKVFAYEIDGYGGSVFMDDANIPSLLSLPDLGFLDPNDEIYQNTRRMILTKRGNPYYLEGSHFRGIGGPHIGIHNAWPMSLLLQIRTTEDDEEIIENLNMVLQNTAELGLIHEAIHVNYPGGKKYTRPWFAWANSEFGKTILDLAERKPYLIFKDDYKDTPYIFNGLQK
jgi:meiotically up-regulated gene 157 (Mug157) protein